MWNQMELPSYWCAMFQNAKDKAKAWVWGQRMLLSTDTKAPFKAKAPTVLFMVSFTIDTLPQGRGHQEENGQPQASSLTCWAPVSHLWNEDDNVVSFVGFDVRTGRALSEPLILWSYVSIESVPESWLPIILSTTTSTHLKSVSFVLSPNYSFQSLLCSQTLPFSPFSSLTSSITELGTKVYWLGVCTGLLHFCVCTFSPYGGCDFLHAHGCYVTWLLYDRRHDTEHYLE